MERTDCLVAEEGRARLLVTGTGAKALARADKHTAKARRAKIRCIIVVNVRRLLKDGGEEIRSDDTLHHHCNWPWPSRW